MSNPGRCDVAILAGGQGTRLRDRTGTLPKPMIPVCGRPLLDYQLDLCRLHGCQRVLLLVHYGHQAITAHVGNGSGHGLNVEYVFEAAPRGTGGALRDALPQLADTFLVLYGDTYLDVDLRRIRDAHARHNADATLFLHPNDHPQDSDLVEVDDEGFVTALHPYPHAPDAEYDNLVNAGLYVMQRDGLEKHIPSQGKADLAKDVFPAMLRSHRPLFGYVSPEYIKDVGTPERLDRVSADIDAGVPERLSTRARRSAVFLDRDGTVNEEVHFLTKPAQLRLLPTVPEALQRLNRSGRLSVVITNQSVVARGDLTITGLKRIHTRLAHLLGMAHAYVDALYFCPHHPDRGYPGEIPELKVACDCRKPETGLVDRACRDLQIDRAASWFVGDTTVDVETGRRAGLRTVLIRTGYAGQDDRFPFRPDYVVPNLGTAVSWILEGHAAMSERLSSVADAAFRARLAVIGGLARTGKSSAAQVLREILQARGRTVHVLPLDSWLKPAAERAEGTGVAARYDVNAMLATVTPLLDSQDSVALELPVYDRARRATYLRPLPMTIEPDDLIVIEGVPALLIDALTRAAGVRVHLDMPEAARVAQVRADYRWRGHTDEAVDILLASRADDESSPVQAARARADFVVSAWMRA